MGNVATLRATSCCWASPVKPSNNVVITCSMPWSCAACSLAKLGGTLARRIGPTTAMRTANQAPMESCARSQLPRLCCHAPLDLLILLRMGGLKFPTLLRNKVVCQFRPQFFSTPRKFVSSHRPCDETKSTELLRTMAMFVSDHRSAWDKHMRNPHPIILFSNSGNCAPACTTSNCSHVLRWIPSAVGCALAPIGNAQFF